MMPDPLTLAKAERRRLQTELTEIAAKRVKAGEPVAALGRLEGAAAKLANDVAVSQWLHNGSIGRRPQLDDIMSVPTTPEVLAARRDAADARPELERLGVEEREARKSFDEAHASVVERAARQMAASFKALGIRADEIRNELTEIEEELAGAYHFFTEASDLEFARTGFRNSELLAAREAALAGLDEETTRIRNVPMPDRQVLAKHREDFAQLQGR